MPCVFLEGLHCDPSRRPRNHSRLALYQRRCLVIELDVVFENQSWTTRANMPIPRM